MKTFSQQVTVGALLMVNAFIFLFGMKPSQDAATPRSLRQSMNSVLEQLALRDVTEDAQSKAQEAEAASIEAKPTARNFTSSVYPCPRVNVQQLKAERKLKSQDAEDQNLLAWFNGLCNGRYIELGGLNGVQFSNSYAFRFGGLENWKGVLIEPSDRYNELVVNRPNEVATIRAAVCEKPQKVHWVPENRAVGGIWEFAAESFRQKWWQNYKLEDLPEIECQPFQKLLDEHAPDIHYYDFLSLDVEGAEWLALQSIDWDKTGFGVILVEADEHNQRKNLAIRSFLESKGYRFNVDYRRSYYFFNENFDKIYGNFI